MPAKQLIVDLAIRYGFQVLGALVILGVENTGIRLGVPLSRHEVRVLDRAVAAAP